jgi:hypothetical protein
MEDQPSEKRTAPKQPAIAVQVVTDVSLDDSRGELTVSFRELLLPPGSKLGEGFVRPYPLPRRQ